MQERVQYGKAYPDAYKAMLALSQAVERTGLAPQLIDLVNYRVSQLNGCAYCLDMHAKNLRARGETEQRLYMISAWREAPHLYSDRERAALAWAEAVTRLVDQQVPDAVYDQAHNSHSHNRSVRNRTNRAVVLPLDCKHPMEAARSGRFLCAGPLWPELTQPRFRLASRITDRVSTFFGSQLKDFARRRSAIGGRLRSSQRRGSGARSMSRTEMVLVVALAAAYVAVTVVLLVPH